MRHRDQLLTLVGQRLRKSLPEDAFLARWGSDEFLVAVPRTSEVALPEDFAEELRQQLELPLSVLPYTLFMTGKLGVSLCPEHASTASRLLDHAEDALYQAAGQGARIGQLTGAQYLVMGASVRQSLPLSGVPSFTDLAPSTREYAYAEAAIARGAPLRDLGQDDAGVSAVVPGFMHKV